jgi:serine/threonine protein kinase
MGQRIVNRYEIQAELGAGGMGTVFRGMDTQTAQTVAIKQLKKELAQPEMLERFRREGQALRDLNHPNIVKLLDALEFEGQKYLIMEYVPGGDLRQLLQNGKLPYQRCLNIAIDLADALTRAHRLNIIHRDLKPANVLVAEDGTIRLTDFGVAHVVDKERVTETNAIVGTLDYLPPEVLNGEAVGPRSDIWAFGVMLFEMLAGQRPFSGNGYLQTLQAIATAPLPDLEALAPGSPTALVDLVYRCLVRDPEARISSVRHIGAGLEDILQGREKASRFETAVADFRLRPKHNLPAQTTPFIGRESELSELARLIQNPSSRLLSIIAQGGMGKTRLSLEVAERAITNFEHGVFFVELAPLAENSSIIPSIAQALSYQFQNDGREPKQQICDYLQARELLLVLDNFEHLLDAAGLVSDLLKAAPKLKILVTSRQRLDQQGESLFHLSGMDFPAWETPEDAINYAAVKLFMNSASRVKPDFELNAANLDAVARVCKLVQGMPLAIVLAASWLGMLSPEEVASELQKGLDFLESDSQQIPERQRSMRAVMEYSWQQMSEAEQAVFAKLSIFRGGFTREATEAVAGANLRILLSLVNKSLLYRDSATGRYEIHPLLRDYSDGFLNSQSRKALEQNYLNYFTNYLAAIPEHKALSAKNMMHIQLEIGNLQAACEIAFRSPLARQSFRLAYLLSLYFNATTQYLLGYKIASQGLSIPDLSAEQTAAFLRMNGLITMRLAHTADAYLEAQDFLKQARAIYLATSPLDKPALLDTLHILARLTGYIMGDIEAGETYLQEGLALINELEEPLSLAQYLSVRSIFAMMRGDTVNSILDLQQALAITRQYGPKVDVSSLLNNIGFDYLQANRLDEAEAAFTEALMIAESMKMADVITKSSLGMGDIARLRGKAQLAQDWYQKCFELSREINHIEDYAKAHERLGRLAVDKADYKTAAVYLLKSLNLALSIKAVPRALFTLPWIAQIYHGTNKSVQALVLISCLEHHPSAEAQLKTRVRQLRASLQEVLPQDTYQAAWERGKSLALQTISQELLAEFGESFQ